MPLQVQQYHCQQYIHMLLCVYYLMHVQGEEWYVLASWWLHGLRKEVSNILLAITSSFSIVTIRVLSTWVSESICRQKLNSSDLFSAFLRYFYQSLFGIGVSLFGFGLVLGPEPRISWVWAFKLCSGYVSYIASNCSIVCEIWLFKNGINLWSLKVGAYVGHIISMTAGISKMWMVVFLASLHTDVSPRHSRMSDFVLVRVIPLLASAGGSKWF